MDPECPLVAVCFSFSFSFADMTTLCTYSLLTPQLRQSQESTDSTVYTSAIMDLDQYYSQKRIELSQARESSPLKDYTQALKSAQSALESLNVMRDESYIPIRQSFQMQLAAAVRAVKDLIARLVERIEEIENGITRGDNPQ